MLFFSFNKHHREFSIVNLDPGSIGVADKVSSNCFAPLKGEGGNIWHPSEVSAAENVQLSDPRIVPEYEMKFKQSVNTEDIFLGVSIIKIFLILGI